MATKSPSAGERLIGVRRVGLAPVCECCGTSILGDPGRCTNGRCGPCHRAHCTPGGITSPGHGRGTVATPFARSPSSDKL